MNHNLGSGLTVNNNYLIPVLFRSVLSVIFFTSSEQGSDQLPLHPVGKFPENSSSTI